MTRRGKKAFGKQNSASAKASTGRKAKMPGVIDAEDVRPPGPGEPASPVEPLLVRECIEYSDGSVEVRCVSGRGYGLFALRGFRPGELVLRIGGQVIYGADYGSEYCIELPPCPRRGPRTLEPKVPGGLINHSCDPNCGIMANSAGHAFLVAECCIGPGSELTIDYAYGFVGDEQIACECGTDHCRGWIVAAEHLPRLKKHHASKNGKQR